MDRLELRDRTVHNFGGPAERNAGSLMAAPGRTAAKFSELASSCTGAPSIVCSDNPIFDALEASSVSWNAVITSFKCGKTDWTTQGSIDMEGHDHEHADLDAIRFH
jgi:hypothetical protein